MMQRRAPISVVIPTLNAAANIGETLTRLMEGVNAGIVRELIISDGGSTDGIEALADELGAEFITGPAGRGGQIARGCAAARSDWILVLHADTWLPDGWTQAAISQLEAPDKAMAFSLKFRSGHAMARITAAWANMRTRWFDLPYGDQALLISRDLFNDIGGYPDQPLMEDVAIAQRLKGKIVLSRLCVQTDPSRYEENGWLAQGLRNLWRLVRYLRGVDPAQLHRDYR